MSCCLLFAYSACSACLHLNCMMRNFYNFMFENRKAQTVLLNFYQEKSLTLFSSLLNVLFLISSLILKPVKLRSFVLSSTSKRVAWLLAGCCWKSLLILRCRLLFFCSDRKQMDTISKQQILMALSMLQRVNQPFFFLSKRFNESR